MKLLSTLTSEDPEYKEFAVSYGRLLSLLSRSGGGAAEPHARRGRARTGAVHSGGSEDVQSGPVDASVDREQRRPFASPRLPEEPPGAAEGAPWA